LKTEAEWIRRQGVKEMLMKTLLDTYRGMTRQITPGKTVSTIPVNRAAANAGRWSPDNNKARRLRRQRRMERATSHRIDGWSVRTW